MKLAQLLKEIKVNTPITTFNVLIGDKNKTEDFVDSTLQGDYSYSKRLVKVSVGPYEHFLNIKVKHAYNLVFHEIIVKDGAYPNLDGAQRQAVKKQLELANRLEDLLKKDRIPYERKDSPNVDSLENIFIYLDKNLINRILYVDGVPFKELANKMQ